MNGKDIKATLGKNIKFFRFRMEYSQADLAEKVDISITFLSNIERGLKFPKPEILSRLAVSLEVEVYELFRTQIVPENSRDLVNRLAEDVSKNVNMTLHRVFKQYME
ncbi:MAG: helix-turn-helix domain-containing protein [Treponema sp.]|nr:helix-turn-helix domain-containing protein [Treponema sp.]